MKSFGELTALVLLFVAASAASGQTLTDDVATNAKAARFVYQDLENFIQAWREVASGTPLPRALQSGYLDRASPGLLMFVEKYDLTLERLVAAIEEHPDEYARMDRTLELLRGREASFREAYAGLAKLIPGAVFPPTYFVVGGFRGICFGSIEGPLVSIEKQSAQSIGDDLNATLIHEMLHMQQLAAVGEAYFAIFSGEERTLLALSIREGAATFFAELITGGSRHKNEARDYLLAHEDTLWQAFQNDMLTDETGDWLWKKPAEPEQPRDIGYALGARIVGSFYDGAADKRAAAKRILSIVDYPAFLAASGYGK